VTLDKQTYRQRAVIKQCVGWLKECRRIGTRFEKLAVHFHAMLQLAMSGDTSNYCFQTKPSTKRFSIAHDLHDLTGREMTASPLN